MAAPLKAAHGRGDLKSNMSLFFLAFLSLPWGRQGPCHLLSLFQQRLRDLGAREVLRCGFVVDPCS